VSAAVYAQRYITDRFLPDKVVHRDTHAGSARKAHGHLTVWVHLYEQAIDLVDEAASRLRLQQESKPEAIENLDRSIITLKIEQEALSKAGVLSRTPPTPPPGPRAVLMPSLCVCLCAQETDTASRQRLGKVREELEAKQAETDALTAKWNEERCVLGATLVRSGYGAAGGSNGWPCIGPSCGSRSAPRNSWRHGVSSWTRPSVRATGCVCMWWGARAGSGRAPADKPVGVWQGRASELRYGIIPELEKQLPLDGCALLCAVACDCCE
jgi:ATP-dependent Clp protease ATP-binding subunit ClpA